MGSRSAPRRPRRSARSTRIVSRSYVRERPAQISRRWTGRSTWSHRSLPWLSSYVVRKRLRLPAEQAMFLFFDGRLPSANSVPLTQLYNDHKDQDGFLYVTYSGENTFGTTL